MKILISAMVFLLVVFASGCAGKRYSTNAPTRPLTQAQADQVRQQKYLAETPLQETWKWNLGLECKLGIGREDVIIGQALGIHDFRVSAEGGNRARRFFLARTQGLVTFFNNYGPDYQVNILEGGRKQVSNMCPGGRITFVAVLPADAGMFTNIPWNNGQNFRWVAEVIGPDGRSVQISPEMSLWLWNWQREQKAEWIIGP